MCAAAKHNHFIMASLGLSPENPRSIAVSTQHGPFRRCYLLELKVMDKFQENLRSKGPKFVESFCPDHGVQKIHQRNKEMDRQGLKSDNGPFPTTSRDGLYQLHLFQTGGLRT